ncbi:hypothetical protein BJ508DRAFT_328169 [Ascobolus immersus RN42]|uniref:Uncharacterized protein n=1 Tax=Ascobolus immersus RN42 TaxID=1160509 RepID=A0A3N4I0G4_ASCIM|nr:hypothetical protein BJ508DRAFT_328169 [Ascobolus immersus RN42]
MTTLLVSSYPLMPGSFIDDYDLSLPDSPSLAPATTTRKTAVGNSEAGLTSRKVLRDLDRANSTTNNFGRSRLKSPKPATLRRCLRRTNQHWRHVGWRFSNGGHLNKASVKARRCNSEHFDPDATLIGSQDGDFAFKTGKGKDDTKDSSTHLLGSPKCASKGLKEHSPAGEERKDMQQIGATSSSSIALQNADPGFPSPLSPTRTRWEQDGNKSSVIDAINGGLSALANSTEPGEPKTQYPTQPPSFPSRSTPSLRGSSHSQGKELTDVLPASSSRSRSTSCLAEENNPKRMVNPMVSTAPAHLKPKYVPIYSYPTLSSLMEDLEPSLSTFLRISKLASAHPQPESLRILLDHKRCGRSSLTMPFWYELTSAWFKTDMFGVVYVSPLEAFEIYKNTRLYGSFNEDRQDFSAILESLRPDKTAITMAMKGKLMLRHAARIAKLVDKTILDSLSQDCSVARKLSLFVVVPFGPEPRPPSNQLPFIPPPMCIGFDKGLLHSWYASKVLCGAEQAEVSSICRSRRTALRSYRQGVVEIFPNTRMMTPEVIHTSQTPIRDWVLNLIHCRPTVDYIVCILRHLRNSEAESDQWLFQELIMRKNATDSVHISSILGANAGHLVENIARFNLLMSWWLSDRRNADDDPPPRFKAQTLALETPSPTKLAKNTRDIWASWQEQGRMSVHKCPPLASSTPITKTYSRITWKLEPKTSVPKKPIKSTNAQDSAQHSPDVGTAAKEGSTKNVTSQGTQTRKTKPKPHSCLKKRFQLRAYRNFVTCTRRQVRCIIKKELGFALAAAFSAGRASHHVPASPIPQETKTQHDSLVRDAGASLDGDAESSANGKGGKGSTMIATPSCDVGVSHSPHISKLPKESSFVVSLPIWKRIRDGTLKTPRYRPDTVKSYNDNNPLVFSPSKRPTPPDVLRDIARQKLKDRLDFYLQAEDQKYLRNLQQSISVPAYIGNLEPFGEFTLSSAPQIGLCITVAQVEKYLEDWCLSRTLLLAEKYQSTMMKGISLQGGFMRTNGVIACIESCKCHYNAVRRPRVALSDTSSPEDLANLLHRIKEDMDKGFSEASPNDWRLQDYFKHDLIMALPSSNSVAAAENNTSKAAVLQPKAIISSVCAPSATQQDTNHERFMAAWKQAAGQDASNRLSAVMQTSVSLQPTASSTAPLSGPAKDTASPASKRPQVTSSTVALSSPKDAKPLAQPVHTPFQASAPKAASPSRTRPQMISAPASTTSAHQADVSASRPLYLSELVGSSGISPDAFHRIEVYSNCFPDTSTVRIFADRAYTNPSGVSPFWFRLTSLWLEGFPGESALGARAVKVMESTKSATSDSNLRQRQASENSTMGYSDILQHLRQTAHIKNVNGQPVISVAICGKILLKDAARTEKCVHTAARAKLSSYCEAASKLGLSTIIEFTTDRSGQLLFTPPPRDIGTEKHLLIQWHLSRTLFSKELAENFTSLDGFHFAPDILPGNMFPPHVLSQSNFLSVESIYRAYIGQNIGLMTAADSFINGSQYIDRSPPMFYKLAVLTSLRNSVFEVDRWLFSELILGKTSYNSIHIACVQGVWAEVLHSVVERLEVALVSWIRRTSIHGLHGIQTSRDDVGALVNRMVEVCAFVALLKFGVQHGNVIAKAIEGMTW